MITGIVKRVITLLRAVRLTESATSPFAIMENTLDELPPGEQAISTKPIKKEHPNGKTSPTLLPIEAKPQSVRQARQTPAGDAYKKEENP